MKPSLIHLSSIALGCLVLAGCAKKPPACSGAETLNTLHDIVVENVQKIPEPTLNPTFNGDVGSLMRTAMGELRRDDPQGIQADYLKQLKSRLDNVVSDGYSEQAKKNSCRAKLTISTASGKEFARDVVFTTQVSESKSQDFVLEVKEFQPFIEAVGGDMAIFYAAKRLQGEWSGTYSCAGIDGQTSGPQGPYQMPVTVKVDGDYNAKLERTTRGGGIEVLGGEMSRFDGELGLQGKGQNSPDDTWLTAFKGKVKGTQLQAKGQVKTPEGQVLRQCSLELAAPAK